MSEAQQGLGAWAEAVAAEDRALSDLGAARASSGADEPPRALPPVRGQKGCAGSGGGGSRGPKSAEAAKAKAKAEAAKAEAAARKPSSHVYDAPDYFRKWDAFDVEVPALAAWHAQTVACAHTPSRTRTRLPLFLKNLTLL